MSYKAREVYKNADVVREYDAKRFRSLKGRFVDVREKRLIGKAIIGSSVVPPAKLLDIPCGTGRLSFFLSEMGFETFGADISPTMIEQCENKAKTMHGNIPVKFSVGDGEALSFPDAFFDIGISLRLFGHLPPENRQNVLKELHRVSKSFVVVAYYHKCSLQRLMREKTRRQKNISWHPVDLEQIDVELQAANLKRIKRFFLFPYVSETVVVLAKKL